MRNLHLLFSWRYLKAKKSTNAINIISWVSILAIIIGTTTLILVLSVFNGFEGLVKSLYSSFYTDLKISPSTGKFLVLTPEQINKIRALDGIRNSAMVVEEKSMIQNGEFQSVMYLKGVDENYRYVTGVEEALVNGSYDVGDEQSPKLILGVGIQNNLGIFADRNLYTLKIFLPRKSRSEQLDLLEDISNDSIHTSAAFMIQQDFDNKYGITDIAFMKRAMKLGANEYSGVEIALEDYDTVDDVKKQIQRLLGPGYLVQDKYEQNRSLYSIMNVERWAIYGILSIVLVVAAFTMIGALTMLVLEKQKDIYVLHALGGDRRFIQKIFLSEGMLLAFIGGAIGMAIALLAAWAQIQFHLIPLGEGSFLIDYFPVKLRGKDFLLVGITVFVIAFIASWFPSRKAAAQEFQLRSE